MNSDTNNFECFCGEEFDEHEKHHIRYACNGLILCFLSFFILAVFRIDIFIMAI